MNYKNFAKLIPDKQNLIKKLVDKILLETELQNHLGIKIISGDTFSKDNIQGFINLIEEGEEQAIIMKSERKNFYDYRRSILDKKYEEESRSKGILWVLPREYMELKSDQEETENYIYLIVSDPVKLKDISKKLSKIITKKEEGIKFPYKLPAGTKWENITFKFSGNNQVLIIAKMHKYHTDYKEMGLVGKGKNPKPSVLWEFLEKLSYEKNGEMIIDNDDKKRTYEKQKELLSKFLKHYFTIDIDPFFPFEPYRPYKHDYSYKIRLQLFPPEVGQSKITKRDFLKPEDENGFKEFYNEEIERE